MLIKLEKCMKLAFFMLEKCKNRIDYHDFGKKNVRFFTFFDAES